MAQDSSVYRAALAFRAAVLREAAGIARSHETTTYHGDTPDAIMDAHVAGVEQGYRDAVTQIAETLEREANGQP